MDLANSRSNENSEALVPAGELLTRALAAYQTAVPPRQEPEGGDEGIPLAHYIWVLRRYRWYILSFVAICTIASFIISKRMKPLYESLATLDVDRAAPSAVVGSQSQPGQDGFDSDTFLATQVELLQSDSVLRPVAEKYNLLQMEQAAGFFAKPAGPYVPPKGPIHLEFLRIVHPVNTYLIRIFYRSINPALSANVANAIVVSYLKHSYEIRSHASAAVSSFMESQLDELKAKMERSQIAVAKFEKDLDVINPEQKTSIISAQLLQLNTEYTNAQADRMKKQAASQSTESGSIDAAQVSTQADLLKKLQDHLNDAQEKFAQVEEQYGPNHPEYAKSASNLKQVQAEFDAARQSVKRRTEVEYKEAVNRENMLRESVAQTKADFDKLNENSYKYQNLKQEADEDKKLYDELVRKIKEEGINSGFENRSVRLADGALPDNGPVSPKIPFNVLLTFVFSTVVGVGGAILADTLDRSISDPEQVVRELRTNLIGSIPLSRDWKFRFAKPEEGEEAALVPVEALSLGTKMLEESVRVLHSSILLSDLDRRIRSILITSVSPRDGKSTTSALLATTNAQQGKKTLLIDGDLRRPSLDRIFAISSPVGLSNVVLGEMDWREAISKVDRVPNLDLLTSGPPSHRAIEMSGTVIGRLLEEAGREYSLIIIDSAPLMNFAEPLHMATAVDGVVIVSVAGQTDRKALSSILSRLARLRANVIGLVMNKVTRDLTENYEYYGYGKYGKYASNYYTSDRS